MQIPKVSIYKTNMADSRYNAYGKIWTAISLIQATKDQECEIFDLPLCGIDLTRMPFKIDNFDDVLLLLRRVYDVDLDHPVILDWNGYIADGWHRIGKAITIGKRTIKAYRLKYAPEEDFILNNSQQE